MFIVVELDNYNDTGTRRFCEALGPYETRELAQKRADQLNSLGYYAQEFIVRELRLKHWSD